MSEQTPQERALAALILETLNFEELDPQDIEPEKPLFGEGLGLDSIDALELALAISQAYGVQLKSDDDATRHAFNSLRDLNEFIQRHIPG
jgi:acyl carrier protein